MNKKQLIERVKNLYLTTPRLVIRRFKEQDVTLEISHESDPEIMRYIADIGDHHQIVEKVQSLLKTWCAEDGEWFSLAVCLEGEEDFIGMVFVRFESEEFSRVEIGYRFHPKYQGKGYAFEATKKVVDFLLYQAQVKKIIAYCVAENVSSYKLMEKLGMEQEGCLRHHSTLNGRWHDELVYGLVAKNLL